MFKFSKEAAKQERPKKRELQTIFVSSENSAFVMCDRNNVE